MNATACRWLLSCIVGILAFNPDFSQRNMNETALPA
jgi:hypothetical protein